MSPRERWRLALEVARWEFRRFVKPKQLAVSVVIVFASAALSFFVLQLFDRSDDEPVTLGVIGGATLGLDADTLGAGFRLRHATAAELPALHDAVGARELDGVITVRDDGAAELVVHRRPSWQAELERELTTARQRMRTEEAGISPAALDAIFEPVALDLSYHESGSPPSTLGVRLLTLAVIVLAFSGVMTGLNYVFIGITGEKQQRITEQIVSAVPPQTWMDGKILGLAAVSIVNTLSTAFGFLALYLAGSAIVPRLRAPLGVVDPVVVALVVIVPLLGFLLWFAFLCAVSAAIDDPYTSTKGSLILVPMIPLAVAGFVFFDPDGLVPQLFSIFPLTGWAVLPTRLLLTEVPWWEIVLAIALLVATIWLFRRAAGKIFATGMLMYGKEPTVREMLRWARDEA